MRQMLVVIALLLLSGDRASPAQKPCSLPWAEESVVVLGADSPDWAIWQSAFHTLRLAESRDGKRLAHTEVVDHVLTPQERTLLTEEAQAQVARDAAHLREQEDLRKAIPEATPAQWAEALQPRILAYRGGILAARDRIRAALSQASWQALDSTLLTYTRRGMETCVPKAELSWFHLPG
jgi:hypothetical protein